MCGKRGMDRERGWKVERRMGDREGEENGKKGKRKSNMKIE